MKIQPATIEHISQWVALRIALWPWNTVEDHGIEVADVYHAGNPDRVAFVALDHAGSVIAFAEASLRRHRLYRSREGHLFSKETPSPALLQNEPGVGYRLLAEFANIRHFSGFR
jgi:hypothetical protein